MSNVKGGGTPVAVAGYAAGAAVVGAVVYAGTEIYKAYEDDNDIPATEVNLQYKRFDPSLGDTVKVDSTYYVR